MTSQYPRIPDEVLNRMIAHRVITAMYHSGLSYRETEDFFSSGRLGLLEQEAIDALEENGELEHLLNFVYFPSRR